MGEGAVLKPNMVKNGIDGPKASPEEVATATINALKRSVPPAMPGIFFLSGETALDEDNEETATINLNTMNKMFKNLPWSVSFSYGKALQKTCIVTWMGKKENDAAAQEALRTVPKPIVRLPKAHTQLALVLPLVSMATSKWPAVHIKLPRGFGTVFFSIFT